MKRKGKRRHAPRLRGYVPFTMIKAIGKWIRRGDQRNISTFIREAAREKLKRDGISVKENA